MEHNKYEENGYGPSVACTVGCTWLMYSLCMAHIWPMYDLYMALRQSGRGHQDDRAKSRLKNNQRLDHKIGPRRIYYVFPI